MQSRRLSSAILKVARETGTGVYSRWLMSGSGREKKEMEGGGGGGEGSEVEGGCSRNILVQVACH